MPYTHTHTYRSLLSTSKRYRSGVKIGTRLLATIQTLWHQAGRVGLPGLWLGEEGALVGKDSIIVVWLDMDEDGGMRGSRGEVIYK